jgi:agmatinase
MARIREMTPHALQIGIRSMSKEEAEWIERERLAVCTMHEFRNNLFNWRAVLETCPDPVYITFDVDAFDWSVIASTGTPEPGGFSWDEAILLLQHIFHTKRVIGCDLVELSYSPHDRNSPFAIAKLIYKMIGMHIISKSF